MHRINLSKHWSRDEREGDVHLRRSFGAPRLTDSKETVWLTGTATTSGVLWVNGTEMLTLAGGMRFEGEISTLLKPRNEAVLVLDNSGELLEAAIEIRH